MDNLNITSIPTLISKYGTLRRTARNTGIVFTTLSRYQFDYACAGHIIVNGVLMTGRSSSNKMAVVDESKFKYEFVDNVLTKVPND